jgi:predicted nucleic acid-binding protein
MRTAIDTNVLSALWGREAPALRVVTLLDDANARGSLILCPVVYMECRANPWVREGQVDVFLETMRVAVEWLLEREIWELAAERFERYASRRRRHGGGEARRFAADFLVAAHALLRADRLVTLDQRSYRTDFPELILVEP